MTDLYLPSSLANALMAAAAFDLSRWPAAISLAHAARTYADLSANTSAIAWTRGLIASFLNWQERSGTALTEVQAALAVHPNAAAQYRLHSIAARTHALRGDTAAAHSALEHARDHRQHRQNPPGHQAHAERISVYHVPAG